MHTAHISLSCDLNGSLLRQTNINEVLAKGAYMSKTIVGKKGTECFNLKPEDETNYKYIVLTDHSKLAMNINYTYHRSLDNVILFIHHFCILQQKHLFIERREKQKCTKMFSSR